jgi:hypothetical protein
MGGRAASQLSVGAMASMIRPRTPGGLATFGSSAAGMAGGGASTRGLGAPEGAGGAAAAAAGGGGGGSGAGVGSGSMLRASSRMMHGLPPGTPGHVAAGEAAGSSKAGPASEHAR